MPYRRRVKRLYRRRPCDCVGCKILKLPSPFREIVMRELQGNAHYFARQNRG